MSRTRNVLKCECGRMRNPDMHRCYKCESDFQRKLRYEKEYELDKVSRELVICKTSRDFWESKALNVDDLENKNKELLKTIAMLKQVYSDLRAASGQHRVCPECWHTEPDGTCSVCGPIPKLMPDVEDINRALLNKCNYCNTFKPIEQFQIIRTRRYSYSYAHISHHRFCKSCQKNYDFECSQLIQSLFDLQINDKVEHIRHSGILGIPMSFKRHSAEIQWQYQENKIKEISRMNAYNCHHVSHLRKLSWKVLLPLSNCPVLQTQEWTEDDKIVALDWMEMNGYFHENLKLRWKWQTNCPAIHMRNIFKMIIEIYEGK